MFFFIFRVLIFQILIFQHLFYFFFNLDFFTLFFRVLIFRKMIFQFWFFDFSNFDFWIFQFLIFFFNFIFQILILRVLIFEISIFIFFRFWFFLIWIFRYLILIFRILIISNFYLPYMYQNAKYVPNVPYMFQIICHICTKCAMYLIHMWHIKIRKNQNLKNVEGCHWGVQRDNDATAGQCWQVTSIATGRDRGLTLCYANLRKKAVQPVMRSKRESLQSSFWAKYIYGMIYSEFALTETWLKIDGTLLITLCMDDTSLFYNVTAFLSVFVECGIQQLQIWNLK